MEWFHGTINRHTTLTAGTWVTDSLFAAAMFGVQKAYREGLDYRVLEVACVDAPVDIQVDLPSSRYGTLRESCAPIRWITMDELVGKLDPTERKFITPKECIDITHLVKASM